MRLTFSSPILLKENTTACFKPGVKLAEKLEAEGYLVKDQLVFGGRFPMTIEDYRLTPMGPPARMIDAQEKCDRALAQSRSSINRKAKWMSYHR